MPKPTSLACLQRELSSLEKTWRYPNAKSLLKSEIAEIQRSISRPDIDRARGLLTTPPPKTYKTLLKEFQDKNKDVTIEYSMVDELMCCKLKYNQEFTIIVSVPAVYGFYYDGKYSITTIHKRSTYEAASKEMYEWLTLALL